MAHRWLPVFYAPALVSLPLAVAPLGGWNLAKAAVIVVLGVPAVLAVAATVVVGVRRAAGTELQQRQPHAEPLRFGRHLWMGWATLALASLLATLLLVASQQQQQQQAEQAEQQAAPSGPLPLPTLLRLTVGAFLLACTVLGYLGGMALSPRARMFLQPMLVAAAAANAGAALLGTLPAFGGGGGSVDGYWRLLSTYLAKGQGLAGPGDLLFLFLGVIILCFGVKVFEEW